MDTTVANLQGHMAILREPADMPWGERLAFVQDLEGNVVTLAMSAPPAGDQSSR